MVELRVGWRGGVPAPGWGRRGRLLVDDLGVLRRERERWRMRRLGGARVNAVEAAEEKRRGEGAGRW